MEPRRAALQRGGWRGRAGSDFRWWLGGQIQLQVLQQKVEFGLGLGVAGEHQLAAIGGWQVDVDHLLTSAFATVCAQKQHSPDVLYLAVRATEGAKEIGV